MVTVDDILKAAINSNFHSIIKDNHEVDEVLQRLIIVNPKFAELVVFYPNEVITSIMLGIALGRLYDNKSNDSVDIPDVFKKAFEKDT